MRIAVTGALTVVWLLSGCSSYLLTTVQDTPTAAGEISKSVDEREIYTSVYVQADATPDQEIVGCANSFITDELTSPQTTIALTVFLPSSTMVELPLYSVSKDHSTCTAKFSNIFLMSPQRLVMDSHPSVSGRYLYNVKSTEQVSIFLSDSLALATVLDPQAGPVLASMDAVSKSALAGKVRDDLNRAFSPTTDITKTFYRMSPADVYTARNEVPYRIVAYKLPERTPTVLGSLTFVIERKSTLIGKNPTGLPQYDDQLAVREAKVVTVDSNGGARGESLYNLVNADPNLAASRIEGLAKDQSATTVADYCRVLRSQLRDKGLNTYDQTAFLWALYSQSAYAPLHDDFTSNTSDCLSSSEMKLIRNLDILAWQHGMAPVVAAKNP